jgi:hypothetical protein
MATHDAEILAQMLRSLTEIIDAKLERLENQRESDSRLTSKQHGENQQILASQSSHIVSLQRQMSLLIGEGPIDGRIGTMQREIKDVQNKLDTMQWKMIGLFGGLLLNLITMIIGYLLTRK